MKMAKLLLRAILLFTLLFSLTKAYSQKVGLVLSGGGSNALAHIGVLQVLEKNAIPIDYIAGTSMGAIVGGLYAAGYSPDDIAKLLNDEEFLLSLQGQLNDSYTYYFKRPQSDPSLIEIKVNTKGPLTSSLPTNLISPYGLDLKMLDVFCGANAVANENFDSLFVPFRCLASDVIDKKSVVFRAGQLNKAIRASATYPFYYKPVLTDGKLLFDGGLYNNFPVDVMIQDFNPDIIIGSNVSYNFEGPNIGDIFSQLKNMLVSQTDYSLRGKPGIIISPKSDYSPFDFNNVEDIILSGRKATESMLPLIQELVTKKQSEKYLSSKRANFNSLKPKIEFNQVTFSNLKPLQEGYIRNSLVRNKTQISFSDFSKKYLPLYDDEQLSYIYPTATFDTLSKSFVLNLAVEREKDLVVRFGGVISSKPINTGFVALKYNFLGNNAYTLEANSYFGKYYSALNVKGRLQTAWKSPMYVEGFSSLNKTDYFTSRATFFEDNKPSFIVQRNLFVGLEAGIPIRYKGKLALDVKLFEQDCNYYLNETFSPSDTADLTQFIGFTPGIVFERNTLNEKQFPTSGSFLSFGFRYINGFERTEPGSTNEGERVNRQNQEWINFSYKYDNYFKTIPRLSFGIHSQGQFNSYYLFTNTKASLIFSPAFQPTPESQTLFLENYRSNKFATLGGSGIFMISRILSFRLEAHLFQTLNLSNAKNSNLILNVISNKRYNLYSSALIFKTPLGPISASLNYYERSGRQLSFILNFGFIIPSRSIY